MKVGCKIKQDKQAYIGCKIGRDKIEQGKIMSDDDGVPSSKNMVQTYRNGVMNRVSRLMIPSMDAHLTRMYKVNNYVKHIASLRKIMKPHAVWDGVNKSFEEANTVESIIAMQWMADNLMSSDICTTNVGGNDVIIVGGSNPYI
jgi:hypothetical protein